MKIEKFAENFIPISVGAVVLLVVLYWLLSNGFGILIFSVLILPIYFIPSFIAYKRNHKYKLQILLLNLFLGFSYIGWVAALIWATLNCGVNDNE